jgi:signal transduction histidine kinase
MDLEAALATAEGQASGQSRIRAALGKLRNALGELRRLIRWAEGEDGLDEAPINLESELRTLLRGASAYIADCRLNCEALPQELPPPIGWELIRIAQEALSNAVRHSQATRVALSATRLGSAIQLCVRDFGRGFLPAESHAKGTGLHSMLRRAERLGGWLSLDSYPGRGTRILVHVPLPDDHGAEMAAPAGPDLCD